MRKPTNRFDEKFEAARDSLLELDRYCRQNRLRFDAIPAVEKLQSAPYYGESQIFAAQTRGH